jgi:OOP family OmpA-OmpF porin
VIIRANPKGHTRIDGYTDSKGDHAYNQKLSERRAESVKNWLVTKEGIDASRLITKGWGEAKPVAPNDTDANRQKNRRVEAIVEKM